MINVYPGPSQLFHSVRDHVRQAIKLRIPELPPSGIEARELVQQTANQLRELLTIPNTHQIRFVPETSGFLNEAIRQTGDDKGSWITHDTLFSDDFGKDRNGQLLVMRHTEERGTSLPEDAFERLRERVGDKLVAVDTSLAWPYAPLPFHVIDAISVEFHLGFGLPAGLGAVILNERWMKHHSIDNASYEIMHPALNLTWVSVLGGVIADMLSRGITTVRRETEYKSNLLYYLLDQHPFLHAVVEEKALRARTIISAQAEDIARVQDELRKHAVSAGFTGNSVIFANFPSHSKEQYERLADILSVIT